MGRLPESGVVEVKLPKDGIELKPGHCYRDGWGHMSMVMGPTRTATEGLVWTLAGNHYRASDGRLVWRDGPRAEPSLSDMVEEVPVPEYWSGVYESWEKRRRT
jgi:hypothetical protein